MGLNTEKSSWGDVILWAAVAFYLLGAGVTVLDVALRSLLGSNVPASIEITSLSIALGALLSIPECYGRRSHVSAKLFSEMAPDRFARPLGLMGAVLSLGFAAMLTWIMTRFAINRWGTIETTIDLRLSMSALMAVVAFCFWLALAAAVLGLWRELTERRS